MVVEGNKWSYRVHVDFRISNISRAIPTPQPIKQCITLASKPHQQENCEELLKHFRRIQNVRRGEWFLDQATLYWLRPPTKTLGNWREWMLSCGGRQESAGVCDNTESKAPTSNSISSEGEILQKFACVCVVCVFASSKFYVGRGHVRDRSNDVSANHCTQCVVCLQASETRGRL